MLADAAIPVVARLLADPARTAMLLALSDGHEAAVSELAGAVGSARSDAP